MSDFDFSIIDVMPTGIFLVDKDYDVVFWNQCMEEWTGFTKSEVMGSSIKDFAPTFNNKIITVRVDSIFDGGPPVVFSSSLHKQIVPAKTWEGADMIQNTTVSSVKSPHDANLALFIIQDVTELTSHIKNYSEMKSRAEKELARRREAEVKLETLSLVVEQNPASIFVTDKDGIIEYINPAFEKLVGYSSRESIGKSAGFFKSGVHDKDFYKELWSTISSGDIWRGDICNKKKNGSLFWSLQVISPIKDETGSVTHYISVKVDDTKRMEAEKALKESEERLLLAQNTAQLGSWDWNVISGEIVWSDNMFNVLGIEKDGIVPSYDLFINHVHSEDRDKVNNAVNRSLELGEPYDVEHRVSLPDGVVKHIHETGMVYYENEKPIRMIGVAQDITERKRTEEELYKGQKLESLGVLAGGIAHDFNNLLTIIQGNISVAMMDMEPEHKAIKTLEKSINATTRAGELTSQLLSFSKGNKPVKKIINLKNILNESVSMVLSGRNTEYICNISSELNNVNADQGQISQVLNNILINAVQAMPKGGTITINADNYEVTGQASGDLLPGIYAKLTIADQGYGMSEKVMSKIFDPYFTTKDEGNGLGLASSYSIIKKHDGTINVESEEGVGTLFTVLLPTENVAVEDNRDKSTDDVKGEGRVLVLDDDESIADLIELILTNAGYKVDVVSSGEEAIRVYKSAFDGRDPFNAVLMDLTIRGGMGGKDAMGILNNFDPNICAIVSSGYSNDPIVAEYEKYGFKASVSKPYRAKDLLSGIKDALKSKS